ncbi:hypothetical protein F5884DRAFT_22471 [Xylogone sp. PMI_703]|nr:hypothetical protein F5884DRAFT_22471 [Xylogone sp. PMI_703]
MASQLSKAAASTLTKAANPTRSINAVVVSAGLMKKTVKVSVGEQKWNKHIRKYFNGTKHLLVHDPRSSLREGDIISIAPGWRVSKRVHHVVESIIAPFGEPIEARPPVPTYEERMAERIEKKRIKDERRLAKSLEGLSVDTKEEEGEGEGVDGSAVENQSQKV